MCFFCDYINFHSEQIGFTLTVFQQPFYTLYVHINDGQGFFYLILLCKKEGMCYETFYLGYCIRSYLCCCTVRQLDSEYQVNSVLDQTWNWKLSKGFGGGGRIQQGIDYAIFGGKGGCLFVVAKVAILIRLTPEYFRL